MSIIPRATYRVQLNRDFDFRAARAIVPYLAELGVSHLYTSPFLKARPGSRHGYDIVDHGALNPEIGTEEEFEALVASLHAHEMQLMIDVVPNHMGVLHGDNRWWQDVLEHGPGSRYADYFDIDWEPLSEPLRGKVLLPILADQYGIVLERGDIRLVFDGGAGTFHLSYFEHRLPIRPAAYADILGADVDPLVGERGLAALCAESPKLVRRIETNVRRLNGEPGTPASFDGLHALIERQFYRLAYWRVAADDINYRRFFDINELAALRAERAEVFEATHRRVFDWIGAGKVQALRIDHPDGLLDPRTYVERLQARAREIGASRSASGAAGGRDRPLYLVLEKVLADTERLPSDWPVHGTTGYRFMNVVNGLFVDTAARSRFDRLYAAFLGAPLDFDRVLRDAKTLIVVHALASDMNMLAAALTRIARRGRDSRDFTLNSLRRAIVDIAACFPVYRTFVTPGHFSNDDRRYIEWATAIAKRASPAADTSVLDFVRDVLCGRRRPDDADLQHAIERFIGRFQQFTAPVMAKGMEDTSFYVYSRLASLNEVGGDPRRFGFTLRAFHAASQDRARHWPHTLLATSTHDNKRAEDVRTRIDVLSEIPGAWRLALRRWGQLNQRWRRMVDGLPAPTRNDEYLLYQTLLGAWPQDPMTADGLEAFRARIDAYMLKAVREAKQRTSWINPDHDYEAALAGLIAGVLGSLSPNPFLQDFIPMQARIARCGALNSLSQTLLKLASPGVPDLYQGCEMWDLSLVDPDNRRPVDYAARRRALRELQEAFAGDADHSSAARSLLDQWGDGRAKLWLIWRALALRARHPRAFDEASYLPLAARGGKAAHLCAFARVGPGTTLVAIAPRLFVGLIGDGNSWPLGEAVWQDTHILLPAASPRHWRDALTGAAHATESMADVPALALGRVLQAFPVALLVAATPSASAPARSDASDSGDTDIRAGDTRGDRRARA